MFEKERAIALIDEAKTQLKGLEKGSIIYKELEIEISQLTDIFTGEECEKRFRGHCEERALARSDVYSSISQMPNGVVNRLYCDIAMLLQPNTLGKLLGILFPQVTEQVKVGLEQKTRAGRKYKDVVLKERGVEALTEPASLARFADLVISGHRVLDVKDVDDFEIDSHRDLIDELSETDPMMSERLYQHNPDLRNISFQLSLLPKEQPPSEAYKACINYINQDVQNMDLDRVLSALMLLHKRERLKAVSEMLYITDTYFGREDRYPVDPFFYRIARSKTKWLPAILELLPERDRMKVLVTLWNSVQVNPRSVLHLLAKDHPEELPAVLSKLPKRDIFPALIAKNRYGDTVLFDLVRSASKQKYLPANLSSIPEEVDLVDSASKQEYLAAVLSLIPEEVRLNALQVTVTRVSHKKMVPSILALNPQSLQTVLSLLPEADRPKAVADILHHANIKYGLSGNPVIFQLAEHPKDLLAFLSLLPEEERLNALSATNTSGDTVLHEIAPNPELIRAVLSLLPEKERFKALNLGNHTAETVLYKVASNPQSLQIVLSLLSNDDLPKAVKAKNFGSMLLHRVARNLESLQIVLALYPKEEWLNAVNEKNDEGSTVLHMAASNPKSLEFLLALYPEEERIKAVKEKNKTGKSVLNMAFSHAESLQTVLSTYPPNERLKAVKEKNENGETVLDMALSHAESLQPVLSLYPPTERLDAMGTEDRDFTIKDRDYLIKQVSNDLAKVRAVLELLPEGVRVDAISRERLSRPLTVRKEILETFSSFDKIKYATMMAQVKYEEWYNKQIPHRGKNGFFSWARHGVTGQNRAKKLDKDVSIAQTEQDAIEQIHTFLTDDKTRYHRHSFASFLLDELRQIPESSWNKLSIDSTNHYDKKNVITQLFQAGSAAFKT